MIPTRILTLRLTLTFGLTLTLTLPNHSAPHPNLKVALMEKLDALDERLFTEWEEWGNLDPTKMD